MRLDIALFLAGLAVTVGTVGAQYRWRNLPNSVTTVLFCLASAMMGAAAALLLSGAPHTKPPAPVLGTSLFLRFPDNHSIPEAMSEKNVRWWYALYTASIYVREVEPSKRHQVAGFDVPPRWAVFLIFDKPAAYRQIVATCAGPGSPTCAVAYSNGDYAIITMQGDIDHATLEVSTLPTN